MLGIWEWPERNGQVEELAKVLNIALAGHMCLVRLDNEQMARSVYERWPVISVAVVPGMGMRLIDLCDSCGRVVPETWEIKFFWGGQRKCGSCGGSLWVGKRLVLSGVREVRIFGSEVEIDFTDGWRMAICQVGRLGGDAWLPGTDGMRHWKLGMEN